MTLRIWSPDDTFVLRLIYLHLDVVESRVVLAQQPLVERHFFEMMILFWERFQFAVYLIRAT